jgi:hypothetical protein
MEQQVMDRRVEARFAPPGPNAARATLRPGCVVALVDVCSGGALVEGSRPLRPGSRVHLQVATAAKTFAIEAHVTRCIVWILDPIDGVRYRGALRFEQRIDWAWGDPSRFGYDLPESAGPAAGARGHGLPVASRAADAARTRPAK